MLEYDLFLEWVSEKASGSWDEMREAWTWIVSKNHAVRPDSPAARAWVAAASLSALGHIEIRWEDPQSWAVCPPVVTMIPNSGGRALVTGARTRALYRVPKDRDSPGEGVLADAAEELGLWIDNLKQDQGPTSVLVACNEPDDAAKLAAACNIDFSYSVSEQLSKLLPPLASYADGWCSRDMPQGYERDGFDPKTLEWRPEILEADFPPGLYRFKPPGKQVHMLVRATGEPVSADREHAVFEVLRWHDCQVVSYDERTGRLWAPVNARLPTLHERAAVLCSGQLPLRQRRGIPSLRSAGDIHGLSYMNVSPGVASRIMASLHQRGDDD